jgi:hypothetical protein
MTMVPVVSPPNFFRFDSANFVGGGHGRTGRFIAGEPFKRVGRLRQERRRLCTRSQRGGACGESKSDFQEIPAFHDTPPSLK